MFPWTRCPLAFVNALILAGLVALQARASENDDGRAEPPSVQRDTPSR